MVISRAHIQIMLSKSVHQWIIFFPCLNVHIYCPPLRRVQNNGQRSILPPPKRKVKSGNKPIPVLEIISGQICVMVS